MHRQIVPVGAIRTLTPPPPFYYGIHSLMFGGYPPSAIGYPPTAIGYTPTAIAYPPPAIVPYQEKVKAPGKIVIAECT